MELDKRQQLFAQFAGKLIKEIYDRGYSCTLGEAYRTPYQAAEDVKEHTGILGSLHCKRLAIDINLFSPNGTFLTQTTDYEPFGRFWENLDPNKQLEWGGRFSRGDGNHYQMKEN